MRSLPLITVNFYRTDLKVPILDIGAVYQKVIQSVRMGRKIEQGVHRSENEIADLASAAYSAPLNKLELEILSMLSEGLCCSEIAKELNYSETVICAFLDRIISKLQANSPAHAIAIAMRLGLIK